MIRANRTIRAIKYRVSIANDRANRFARIALRIARHAARATKSPKQKSSLLLSHTLEVIFWGGGVLELPPLNLLSVNKSKSMLPTLREVNQN